MKRVGIILTLLCCIFLGMFPISISAAQRPSLKLEVSDSEPERKQRFEVTVSLDGDAHTRLLGMRLNVEYDDTRLTLKSITPGPSISKQDFRFSLQSRSAAGIFASAGEGVPWNTEFASLVFEVNENAPLGLADVSVTMDELVGRDFQYASEPLEETASINVVEPESPSGHGILASLRPSSGTLTPPFSRENTEYTLTVPYEVTALTFDTETVENGSVSVNRKNLNSPGTPTVFIITVTSADRKNKTSYTVTVYRLEKGQSSSSSVSSQSQTSSRTSSSKTSSSKTSSSRTSSSKISSSKASSSKTSSSRTRTASSVPGKTSDTGTVQPETSEPVYQTRYISQNTNRMPGFLLGILSGCIGMILIVLIVLLLAQRHKRSKSDDEKQDKK